MKTPAPLRRKTLSAAALLESPTPESDVKLLEQLLEQDGDATTGPPRVMAIETSELHDLNVLYDLLNFIRNAKTPVLVFPESARSTPFVVEQSLLNDLRAKAAASKVSSAYELVKDKLAIVEFSDANKRGPVFKTKSFQDLCSNFTSMDLLRRRITNADKAFLLIKGRHVSTVMCAVVVLVNRIGKTWKAVVLLPESERPFAPSTLPRAYLRMIKTMLSDLEDSDSAAEQAAAPVSGASDDKASALLNIQFAGNHAHDAAKLKKCSDFVCNKSNSIGDRIAVLQHMYSEGMGIDESVDKEEVNDFCIDAEGAGGDDEFEDEALIDQRHMFSSGDGELDAAGVGRGSKPVTTPEQVAALPGALRMPARFALKAGGKVQLTKAPGTIFVAFNNADDARKWGFKVENFAKLKPVSDTSWFLSTSELPATATTVRVKGAAPAPKVISSPEQIAELPGNLRIPVRLALKMGGTTHTTRTPGKLFVAFRDSDTWRRWAVKVENFARLERVSNREPESSSFIISNEV